MSTFSLFTLQSILVGEGHAVELASAGKQTLHACFPASTLSSPLALFNS